MTEILSIIKDFKKGCACGRKHETAVRDVIIESGAVNRVGEILAKNGFSKNILLVADKNTLKASEGIAESLKDFSVIYKLYDTLRLATMEEVEAVESLLKDKDISVLSVGTGSLNDICRLAAARQNKLLCIFGTAPSMDGFASYCSPIVKNGFKYTYPAKSPEVIIGDTKILASAPAALKSAGFGDMVAKYVGLVDWQISALLTGEYYCEKIATLTRSAVDELMEMADKVTIEDENTAGKIFEALLKTGIGMSFSQNSRPASGSEHIISHLLECVELRDGILPNFHGDDIGVATLKMLEHYNKQAELKEIETQDESLDWDDIFAFYGNMKEDVVACNFPDNIIDEVDKDTLRQKWGEIVDIIKSVPSLETCREAMRKAGCKLTVSDIGKDENLFAKCIEYSPYMRKRLTLLRLKNMIKQEKMPKYADFGREEMYYKKEYMRKLFPLIRMQEEAYATLEAHFEEIEPKEAETLAKFWADTTVKRPEKLDSITEIEHRENGDLLCVLIYMAASGYVHEEYRKRGIPDEIFYNTFSCLAEKMETNMKFKGTWGYPSVTWPALHTGMQIFRIGRLSYEMKVAEEDVVVNENLVIKKGQKHLYLHIPDNDKLCGCEESIEEARAFFSQFYPEYKDAVMYTRTWLLDPRLSDLLPPESNIMQFQKLFNILDRVDNVPEVMRRIFGEYKENLDEYVPSGGFAGSVIRYLKEGKMLGSGMATTKL